MTVYNHVSALEVSVGLTLRFQYATTRMAEIKKCERASPSINSGAQSGSCSPSFSLAFST